MKFLPLKVLYTGAIKDLSGYAEAARDYVRALDTVDVDVSVEARSFESQSTHLIEEVVERRIWAMIGKPKDAHLQIIHLTPDNYSQYRDNNRVKIGYYAWETSRLPLAWVNPINDICKEVWVPCEYLKDVSIASGVTVPVEVVPHAIPLHSLDKSPNCSIDRLPDDKFKFYSIFQWCHDNKTRVLTRDGFKFFYNLTSDDWLATVNKETCNLEYQKPDKVIKFPYKGNLIHSNSEQFNFAITPEHKLLVKEDKDNSWRLRKTNSLIKEDSKTFSPVYKTLQHTSWNGEDSKYFYFSKTKQDTSNNRILMEDFLHLFGLYLSKEDLKTEDIFKMTLSKQDKVYLNKFNLYIKEFELPGNKFIPIWLKGLSSRLIKIFLNTLLNGEWIEYNTDSKQLAEDILECLLKVGMNGNISSAPYCLDEDKIGYTVSINNFNLEPSLSNIPITKEYYDGKVFCASVKNETLITERNGKILISGNSNRKNPDALIRAYYQEFSSNDPVCLVLKTYRVGNALSERNFIRREISRLKRSTKGINCPQIILIEEFLGASEIEAIHYYCDCYISTARSEGFCWSKGTLVDTLTGPKPIESIEEDDIVFSHTGKLRKVTGKTKRQAFSLIDFKIYGNPTIFSGTSDHPHLVLKRFNKNPSKIRECLQDKVVAPKWIPLSKINKGDYVVFPKLNEDNIPPSLKYDKKLEFISSARKGPILEDENNFYLPITEVASRSSNEQVYNLHVEEDESYTLSGMATHNCIPAFNSASFGNPIIVPNYSAFPEHFHEGNSYLIDVPREVPVRDMRHISLLYTGDMLWGDPSIESLQTRMREVFNNQEIAKNKGIAARDYIKESLSHKTIGRLMKGKLERINKEIASESV
jgi:hypothetical protein